MNQSAAIYIKNHSTGDMDLVNLFKEEAIIGSSEKADVRINDFRSSGIHAYIKRQGDHFVIVDLGSVSGTYVHGKRIVESRLVPGESFTIGNDQFFIKNVPKSLDMYSGILAPHKEKSHRLLNLNADHKNFTTSSKDNTLITDRNLLQVSLYWGQKLIDVRTFKTGAKISVGSNRRAKFNVTLNDQDFFYLGHYKREGLLLAVPENCSGIIWTGNEAHKLTELIKPDKDTGNKGLLLRVGDRADIHIGEMTLSFKFVLPPERIPRFLWTLPDKKLIHSLSAVVLLYLLFFSAVIFFPKSKIDEKEMLAKIPQSIKKIIYDAGVKNGKQVKESAIGAILSKEGGRAAGESGVVKTQKAPVPEKTVQSEPSKVKKKTKKMKAEMVVAKNKNKNNKSKKINIGAVFRTNGVISSAVGRTALQGNLENGNSIAAINNGKFGRGSIGFGVGGGGKSVGVGQLKGLSTGGGMGSGDVGVVPKKGREIKINSKEEVLLMDALDPEVIAAIIKRYLPQIQHCYEMRLVHIPTLKGKVLVKFQIVKDGSVRNPSIMESTLNDKGTEECILTKINKWSFPQPKGGGVVEVKYPFLLMSTNDH